MIKHTTLKRIALLLFIVFLLASCQTFNPETEKLTWEAVSTPPGFVGSCYAYFINQGIGDQMHSYSSVWCSNSPQTETKVVNLDWKKVPSPMNDKDKRCYGYFVTDGIGSQQHSTSGTWCY